jgi:hypothetical protein
MTDGSETMEFKSNGSVHGRSPTEGSEGRWEQHGHVVIIRQVDPQSKQTAEMTGTITNDDGIDVLEFKESPKDELPLMCGIRKEAVSQETQLFGLWVGQGSDPFAISLDNTYSAVMSAGMMSWPAKWRRHGKDIIVETIRDTEGEAPLRVKISLGAAPDTLDVFSPADGKKLETLRRAGKRKPQSPDTPVSP